MEMDWDWWVVGAPKIGVGGQRIEGQKCAIFFVPERMHIWRSARTCLHATIDNNSSKKYALMSILIFLDYFFTLLLHIMHILLTEVR